MHENELGVIRLFEKFAQDEKKKKKLWWSQSRKTDPLKVACLFKHKKACDRLRGFFIEAGSTKTRFTDASQMAVSGLFRDLSALCLLLNHIGSDVGRHHDSAQGCQLPEIKIWDASYWSTS